MSDYLLGVMSGRAREGRHQAVMATHSHRPTDIDTSGVKAREQEERHKAEMAAAQGQILDLKKRLVAARSVRDTLRAALREVAPDHAYLNPSTNNPTLSAVAIAAGERVKKWDETV